MSNIIKNLAVKLNHENTVYIDVKKEEPQEILKVDHNTEEIVKENILVKAQQDARETILEAEKQAEEILNQAREDAALIQMKAKEEGHKQGYQEGLAKGSEESEKLLLQAKRELDNAFKEKKEIIHSIEPKMIELILNISEKILGTTVKTNTQFILYLIKKGFLEVKDQDDTITIKISEEDYPTAIEFEEDILNNVGFTGTINIVKDLSLKVGDCIIETQFGNIDCGLGTQFEGLKQELVLTLDNK